MSSASMWPGPGNVTSTAKLLACKLSTSLQTTACMDNCAPGPGQRLMSSLRAHLASAPAEDLHTSQAKSVCAHRANGKFHWHFASWNVRLMLGTEGSIKTARQGRDTLHAEDRKVDLVVRELGRYNIKVAALQETKWNGK